MTSQLTPLIGYPDHISEGLDWAGRHNEYIGMMANRGLGAHWGRRLRADNSPTTSCEVDELIPPVALLGHHDSLIMLGSDGACQLVEPLTGTCRWKVRLSGIIHDWALRSEDSLALLNTDGSGSTHITQLDCSDGAVVDDVRTPSIAGARWLGCTPEGGFAVAAPHGDSVIFIPANGEDSVEVPIGAGLAGMWTGGQSVVTAWNAGGRLVRLHSDELDEREVIVLPEGRVMNAAVAGDGSFAMISFLPVSRSGFTLRLIRWDSNVGNLTMIGDVGSARRFTISPTTRLLGLDYGESLTVVHIGATSLRSAMRYRRLDGEPPISGLAITSDDVAHTYRADGCILSFASWL